MSVISSLLLFFLCVSFQSCYGRHLGALRKEPETKSSLPYKNDEIMASTPGAGEAEAPINRVSRVEKEDDQKPSSSSQKAMENKATASGDVEETDQPRPSHPLSWQAPAPKTRDEEEQPGYSSDYPCPKTHPPSHN